jgi:toxin ParE1/3/4
MPLRIRRGAKARADQSAIWLYISTENMTAADRQIDRLHDCFGMLASHPAAGRMRIEFDASLRAFPVDQYLVFYRVSPGLLEIARILHAARDITPDMLTD